MNVLAQAALCAGLLCLFALGAPTSAFAQTNGEAPPSPDSQALAAGLAGLEIAAPDTHIALSRLSRAREDGRVEEALDGFTAWCEDGVQVACLEAEEIRLLAAAPSDPAEARAYHRQACEGGGAPACTQLGVMLDSMQGGERDLLGARAAFLAACQGRHREGCAQLAGQMYVGMGGSIDQEGARLLAAGACAMGGMRGCWAYGTFADEEGRPGEALVFYETACNGRFEVGCFTLFFRKGQIAAAQGRLGDAYDHYASACDRDAGFRGWVCNQAADLALNPENPKADPDRARAHRQRACTLNFTLACTALEASP